MSWGDASLGWASLIVPAVIAAILALAIPYMLGRALPETMRGLMINLVISAGIMWLISCGYFALTYVQRGIETDVVLSGAGLMHVALTALKSAIFWLPLVLVQLATQPQRWRPEL